MGEKATALLRKQKKVCRVDAPQKKGETGHGGHPGRKVISSRDENDGTAQSGRALTQEWYSERSKGR